MQNQSFDPVARIPSRRTYADEFLHLMEQKKNIDRRLDELVEILDPTPTLPKSGLRLAGTRPGHVLFNGGRAHG